MSFEDYVNRTSPTGEVAARFDHSAELLPVYDDPTPEQKAEITGKAREIAAEIGGKFDAEMHENTGRTAALFNEMQRYWQAPPGWGMLPTPPPIQLFQQWAGALQHWLGVCRGYETDALKLAKAGVPEFKAYLQLFVDDTSKALDTIKNTPTAPMATSPANFGAPPGWMNPFGATGFHPFGPMTGPPMPPPHMAPPMPFGNPLVNPYPLPFAAGVAPIPAAPPPHFMPSAPDPSLEIMRQVDRDRQKATDDAVNAFDSYLRS